MNNHRYILQKYTGISSRHTCPSCGHKHEFTLYFDTETSGLLHPSVGKCNRESKCGYHYTPGDYFRDNPDNTPSQDWKPSFKYGLAQLSVEPKKTSVPDPVFLPMKYIPTNQNIENCNLYKFFVSKFGEDKTKEVFDRYKVGVSKHWRNDNGLSAAFPQIDINGKLRQIKVIAYNPITGKRLHKEHPAEKFTSKGYVLDMAMDKVWFAGKSLLGDYDANLQQCFFGEHLIRTAEKIAIVESEKTAMIASLYLPQFVWVATGGKNGCKWDSFAVFKSLSGKSIILYPDLNCFEIWAEKAIFFKKHGFSVHASSFLEKTSTQEQKERGLDIADYLLSENPIQDAVNHERESGHADFQPLHRIPERENLSKLDIPKNKAMGETSPKVDYQALNQKVETSKGGTLNTIGELLEYAYSIGGGERIKIGGYGG